MAAGGVTAALIQATAIGRKDVFIQIEVETLEQLAEALDAGATMILLDNMDLAQMRQAVGLTAGRAPNWRPRAESAWKPCAPSPKPAWTASPSAA
jgi:nicotinate-nucleotide pyrophosphorylase